MSVVTLQKDKRSSRKGRWSLEI